MCKNNGYPRTVLLSLPCTSADVVDVVDVAATAAETLLTISLPFPRPTAAKSFSDTQSKMLNSVFVSRSKSPKL